MTKKIIFTTMVLFVFSVNISYSEDVSFDQTLDSFKEKLNFDNTELRDIYDKLERIEKDLKKDSPEITNIFIVRENILAITKHYYYIFELTDIRHIIDKNYMKSYLANYGHNLETVEAFIRENVKIIRKYSNLIEDSAAIHQINKAINSIPGSVNDIRANRRFVRDTLYFN